MGVAWRVHIESKDQTELKIDSFLMLIWSALRLPAGSRLDQSRREATENISLGNMENEEEMADPLSGRTRCRWGKRGA